MQETSVNDVTRSFVQPKICQPPLSPEPRASSESYRRILLFSPTHQHLHDLRQVVCVERGRREREREILDNKMTQKKNKKRKLEEGQRRRTPSMPASTLIYTTTRPKVLRKDGVQAKLKIVSPFFPLEDRLDFRNPLQAPYRKMRKAVSALGGGAQQDRETETSLGLSNPTAG